MSRIMAIYESCICNMCSRYPRLHINLNQPERGPRGPRTCSRYHRNCRKEYFFPVKYEFVRNFVTFLLKKTKVRYIERFSNEKSKMKRVSRGPCGPRKIVQIFYSVMCIQQEQAVIINMSDQFYMLPLLVLSTTVKKILKSVDV